MRLSGWPRRSFSLVVLPPTHGDTQGVIRTPPGRPLPSCRCDFRPALFRCKSAPLTPLSRLSQAVALPRLLLLLGLAVLAGRCRAAAPAADGAGGAPVGAEGAVDHPLDPGQKAVGESPEDDIPLSHRQYLRAVQIRWVGWWVGAGWAGLLEWCVGVGLGCGGGWERSGRGV